MGGFTSNPMLYWIKLLTNYNKINNMGHFTKVVKANSAKFTENNQIIKGHIPQIVTFDKPGFESVTPDFDLGYNRFKPTSHGIYLMHASVQCFFGRKDATMWAHLIKNGRYSVGGNSRITDGEQGILTVTGMDYFNGKTDYVELYLSMWHTSVHPSFTIPNTITVIAGNKEATYFTGYKLGL